ncbi:hypothetical protein HDU99_002036, partial [Rhizoclosmatium hyalinum]
MERRGGFDEYVMTIGKGKCGDEKAEMYKKLVEEAFVKKGAEVQKADAELVEGYGDEYT